MDSPLEVHKQLRVIRLGDNYLANWTKSWAGFQTIRSAFFGNYSEMEVVLIREDLAGTQQTGLSYHTAEYREELTDSYSTQFSGLEKFSYYLAMLGIRERVDGFFNCFVERQLL